MKALAFAPLVLAGFVATAYPPGPAQAVDEYVMAKIECPAETHTRLNWTDRIGSSPEFVRLWADDLVRRTAVFKQSSLSGQKVECLYVLPEATGSLRARYLYTVKRKIISCEGVGGRVLQCKVKP